MGQFIWNTITTTDLEASKNFYTEILGLKVEREFTSPTGATFVFMADANGFEIELILPPTAVSSVSAPTNLSMGYLVPDLDVMIQHLKEKGIPLEGDVVAVPHTRFCFVKDPNGVTVQFVERN